MRLSLEGPLFHEGAGPTDEERRTTVTLRDPLQRALGDAYELERELTGGGMSTLFLAHDRLLDRRVVIKVLPRERSEGLSLERFRAEIRLAAALQHPHIVAILSAGEVEGLPYYIMPYIAGESLRALLMRESRLPPRQVVAILRDVVRGCAFAHGRGVVHRDIKPDNILLAGGAALITDFGVAKALTAASPAVREGTLTREGFTVGTPAYMAPEQLAGDPAIDQRADFYALGVTAYEALAGATPFAHLTPRALLAAQLTERAPPLARHRTDVPRRLSALIASCLEKDPGDRPENAGVLLATLDDPLLLSDDREAEIPLTPTVDIPGVRLRRRSFGRLMTLGATGLAVIAGVWLLGRPRGESSGGSGQPILVAVLPFADSSTAQDAGYLADGVTESVGTLLGTIPAIRVVSRNGVERYRDDRPSPTEVGSALGANHVVQGVLRRRGDRLELFAEAFDAVTGKSLGSASATGERDRLPALTSELATEVLTALAKRHGRLPRSTLAVRSGFRNPDAYDRYLQGLYALRRRGAEPLKEAADHFAAAVTLDSTAAPAFAGLADVYALLPLYAGVPPGPTLARALEHAERAVALDTASAVALASRGNVLTLMWQWDRGRRDLERAVQLDPELAIARQWYGESLLLSGKVTDAVNELARASSLDPWSAVAAGLHGVALALSGKPEEAIREARRAVDLDPSLAAPRILLGAVYLYTARPFDAVFTLAGAVELEPDNPQIQGLLGYSYAALGQRDRAETVLRQLAANGRRTGNVSAMARVHLALGHPVEAIALLERAAEERDPLFASEPLLTPIFEPIRQHPRFRALLAKIGLALPA